MKKSISLLLLVIIAFATTAKGKWTLQGDTYNVDTLFHAKVGPGTTQTSLKVLGPVQLRVFYTTTDLTNNNVDVKHVMANDKLAGLATVSSMAKSKSKEGAQYFVGINADFFSNNKPVGSAVVDKEVYYAVPWRTQWAIDADKKIHLGDMTFGGSVKKSDGSSYPITTVNYDRNEDNLTIYTPRFGATTNTNQYGTEVVLVPLETNGILTSGESRKMRVSGTPATAGNMAIPSDAVVLSGHGKGSDFVATLTDGEVVEVETIVKMPNGEQITPVQLASGCPMILSNGVVLDNDHLLEATPNRHPRTAVGYDATGTKFVMLVVDGRTSISAGAYPKVLADIMREVGCEEAMNFDGGGSSTLYVQNLGVRNYPSDGGVERTVTNGVYLVANTPTDTEIAEIQFVDWSKELPKYGYYTPKFYGYNKYGVLVDTDLQGVTLTCSAELGDIVDDGISLYANGGGTHALNAEYNGVKTSIAVAVNETVAPVFRHKKILLDSYREYKVDVYGTVKETDEPMYNNAIKWECADESIVSVDENGVIKGLKNGSTILTGQLEDFKGEIEITVEIPEGHTQSVEKGFDVNTWKFEGINVENHSITPFGTDGFAMEYTTTSARKVSLNLTKDVVSWSRPDSLLIDINPTTADIKTLYLYFTDYRDEATQLLYELKQPVLTESTVNRLLIPMSSMVDIDDMSTYPLELDSISIVPGNPKGTTHRIEVSKFAWVYNAVSKDNSGIDNISIKNNKGVLLSPNPVQAGEVVKIDVEECDVYTVTSMNGTEVKQGRGTDLDTTGMTSGLYLVTVRHSGGVKTAKLVIR